MLLMAFSFWMYSIGASLTRVRAIILERECGGPTGCGSWRCEAARILHLDVVRSDRDRARRGDRRAAHPPRARAAPNRGGDESLKPRTKRALWIVAGARRARRRGGARAERVPVEPRVLLHARSQVAAHEAPQDRAFRIGGLVEEGSVVRDKDALTVHFRVTDTAKTIPVIYTGILPGPVPRGQGRGRAGHSSAPTARSTRARCSPSTTRTTCRRRPPRR